MAISYIGVASAETNAVTPPAHIAGDLLICFTYRDGSNTVPTLASGWTNINSAGSNTNSYRVAYKVAASSSETCTGWTGANNTNCHVYRGAYLPGASAHSSASSTTLTYPALTLQNTSGSSWVVGFAGHRSIDTTTINTPPTGMTNRRVQLGTTCDVSSHDTNGGVSAWNSTNVTTGGTASGHYESVVEVIPAEAPTLSSADVSVASSTSGVPSVTTNWRNGTIYCVTVANGDTPTVTQIKAGQNSSGSAAISSSTLTVSGTGVQTLGTITGLTTNTDYDVWFVHTNTYGNSSAVKADFKPIVRTNTGWMTPGTVITENLGALFANPSNASAEDGSFAAVTLANSQAALLLASNYGASIPTSSVIRGMEVRVKGMDSAGDTTVNIALSIDASSQSASTTGMSSVAFTPTLTTTNEFQNAGATSGWSWTYWQGFIDGNTSTQIDDPTLAQINSSNFGVVLTTFNFSGSNRTVSIDTLQLRIHFTEPGGGAIVELPALFWAFP